MTQASRISCDFDMTVPGFKQGFLRVPYSSNVSAYGWIPIPIVVKNGGPGPTILVTAGVHGDEYEGQIALTKLARTIADEEVAGRIVILPALNSLAARAGKRLSPVDGHNLNRCFPGDRDGSPTEMIAHYMEAVLMPQCDLIIDIHSGGNSLLHHPCGLIRNSADPFRRRELRRLAAIFGVPTVLVKSGQPGEEGLPDRGMAGAAERLGKLLISSELGGGGTVSSLGLKLAEDGIRRLLVDAGLLAPSERDVPADPCRFLTPGGKAGFVHALSDGVYEPLANLGDVVMAGQPAARIHDPELPWRGSDTLSFQASGLVVCQRSFGRVEPGDCLFHLGVEETNAQ